MHCWPEKKRDALEREEYMYMRMERGLHHTLYSELCADEKKFFNYFRMSKPTFDELLGLIRNDITRTDTIMRQSIKPEDKLAVTLR